MRAFGYRVSYAPPDIDDPARAESRRIHAAIALARDNKLPVVVFSIKEEGNLLRVLRGEARCTVIE